MRLRNITEWSSNVINQDICNAWRGVMPLNSTQCTAREYCLGNMPLENNNYLDSILKKKRYIQKEINIVMKK